MGLRRLVIEVDPSTLNVTEFCRVHGISTWFFYDLRRRHRAEGDVVLEPRSCAPKRVANRTPVMVEDAIVAKRKELVDAGLDAGPGTIVASARSRGSAVGVDDLADPQGTWIRRPGTGQGPETHRPVLCR